jgi:hypothetical protein
MKSFKRSAALAAAAAAALALPALAAAHGGPPSGVGHGRGDAQGAPSVQQRSHGRSAHEVGYVFAGTVKSIDGTTVTVTVRHANHHGHALVGQDVAFDASAARVVVRDLNGDGVRNLADVSVGDRVQVLARLPRDLSGVAQPFPASVLIDRARPQTQTQTPDPAGS